ncbi:hypothetical protein HOE67_04370 [Candidatus Peregrinibacteria bacterium]|nr:hypothetical protein [Candidatus Peregrinibacteria bacterium]
MNKKVEQNQPADQQHNKTQLMFHISELLNSHEGARDSYEIDTPVSFDDPDIIPKSNLTGTVNIMRLDKEFNVQLEDIEIQVERPCDKCGEACIEEIYIEFADIEFLIQRDHDIESREDIFHVNTKNWTIDLTEWLRQEIILHFPLVSVCSIHKLTD